MSTPAVSPKTGLDSDFASFMAHLEADSANSVAMKIANAGARYGAGGANLKVVYEHFLRPFNSQVADPAIARRKQRALEARRKIGLGNRLASDLQKAAQRCREYAQAEPKRDEEPAEQAIQRRLTHMAQEMDALAAAVLKRPGLVLLADTDRLGRAAGSFDGGPKYLLLLMLGAYVRFTTSPVLILEVKELAILAHAAASESDRRMNGKGETRSDVDHIERNLKNAKEREQEHLSFTATISQPSSIQRLRELKPSF